MAAGCSVFVCGFGRIVDIQEVINCLNLKKGYRDIRTYYLLCIITCPIVCFLFLFPAWNIATMHYLDKWELLLLAGLQLARGTPANNVTTFEK